MKDNWTEDYITLKIEKIKSDGHWTGQIIECKELKGVIAQAKSEEELKERLSSGLKSMLHFYSEDNFRLRGLAIFDGMISKHGQFWFSILGIGLVFNWVKKGKNEHLICITKPGGLRIGKLLVFFKNHWRIKKFT